MESKKCTLKNCTNEATCLYGVFAGGHNTKVKYRCAEHESVEPKIWKSQSVKKGNKVCFKCGGDGHFFPRTGYRTGATCFVCKGHGVTK